MTHILDIIGPIMIGPSSSHTAGAARLGKLAKTLLGESLAKAEIELFGSFAKTYLGHGTHLALLGGLLGFDPDDERIRKADEIASRQFDFCFSTFDAPINMHPNTVRLILRGGSEAIELVGASLGGGRVVVNEIDGFSVRLDGERTVIIVHSVDIPGVITSLTSVLSEAGVNIGNMSVSRTAKGAKVIMTIEIDCVILPEVLARVEKVPGITKVSQVTPL
ncbi:MAG: L-serine ammonia-lyase, iron-sulfur-dependent subunit beta [bacterium]|nr:L-serine ammonia-lyase, iron-sulfur-dependent subunit beta [bacterium]